MKRMFVLSVAILLFATPLLAQGGTIALFGDPGGSDCNVVDTQPNSLVQVYVFHLFASDVRTSAFAVPIPACALGLEWLADTRVFPFTDGFSPTGIIVQYQVCLSTPLHILTIQYWAQGSSDTCCGIGVAPDPRQAPWGIVALDCDFNFVDANGVGATINADPSCPCFNVPVEHSTWGKVKALYSE